MKKRVVLGAAVLSVLLVFAIPVYAGKGVHVHNGAVQQPFRNSGPYIQRTIEGSGGKVVLNQPSGAVAVTLTGVVNGLDPYTDYYAYLWAGQDGYCPYWCGTNRPLNNHYVPTWTAGIPSWWDGSVWYGTWFRFAEFTTGADGAASFHLNIFAEEIAVGDYKLSVFVDSVLSGNAAHTYLIAEPIPIIVE